VVYILWGAFVCWLREVERLLGVPLARSSGRVRDATAADELF